jgi:predicted  nucleic acid-binding Zn-ribbon protein
MSNDDLDHIPPIVPTRDGAPRPATRRVSSERRSTGGKGPSSAGSASLLWRLVTAVALVAAALACVLAWQLQTQLQQASDQLESYATRIADLEARLSDTDEGMNQSAAVQAVKIAELDSEVRKLWDFRKQARGQLTKLEASSTGQGKSFKGLQSSVASIQSQLKAVSDDIAKLKSVGGDLARLMSSAKANQAEVERVADSLNRIDLALSRLEKRVEANEEWVASVNAFRRQVNTSLSELKATVRAMQASP